ncbi:RNA-guided endonuclease IscB [Ohessyouella blattaphilus]|uniref:RNA-guided endonuclease IscB n=1 Tax=Ohessyouella blattaphilus TaxID=2949333 RepID=UPI003E227C0D
MVYVISREGQPLMPTTRHGKVKHLLREGKVKVIKRCPFTIQLTYESTTHTQPITLGVDAGSKTVGLSATTETEELYASETKLRTDIVELLATKRQYRRSKRSRKTRYRKPRFSNRVRSKNKGWFAPSVEHKVNSHLKLVADVYKILPITELVVEVASFDIQKIKNPNISGAEYQQGEKLDAWNVREYVLWRDGHTCQHCKGKSKDKILQTHHLESRKVGGDAPNNLVTLCKTCHDAYHAGKIQLNLKRGASFRDAAFMGIMRWAFYNKLKEVYPNVSMTYGYITKHVRINNDLEKTHAVDARCISGHPLAEPLGVIYNQKFVRCNNRSLHKANPKKGVRKSNQAPRYVQGYQLFDKVKFEDKECFVFGRRSSGYFDIRLLDGTSVHKSVGYKKLRLLEQRSSLLTERRLA